MTRYILHTDIEKKSIMKAQQLLFAILLLMLSHWNCSVNGQGHSKCKDVYGEKLCKVYQRHNMCKVVNRACCNTCSPQVRSLTHPFRPTTAKACVDQLKTCPTYVQSKSFCGYEKYRNYCLKSCNACHVGKPTWTSWTVFSACSATCGFGNMVRSRKCSVPGKCLGGDKSIRSCYVSSCLYSWGAWSKYGICSTTCGYGEQIRTRSCARGGKCKGLSVDRRKCTNTRCRWRDDPQSNDWSRCTRTCGGGSQYQFISYSCMEKRNPRCFRRFRECNTNHCPTVYCPMGQIHRYNTTSSCCKVKGGYSECGMPKSFISRRIIGGRAAQKDQWPWMARLSIKGALCGATLIHRQWLVTAGHCIKDGNTLYQPSQIKVKLGSRYLSGSAPLLSVQQVILHPKYKKLQFDIALIKLTHPVVLSSTIQTVCLPKGEVPAIDSTCYALGWGLTESNNARAVASEHLKEVGLKNMDVAVCRKVYANDQTVGSYVMDYNNLLCAGSHLKSNDVCKGDSGGPLLCQRCDSCSWYIAGVTSFGAKNICGRKEIPGMYTKVASFESWIHQYIPSLKSSLESCSKPRKKRNSKKRRNQK